MASPRFYTEEKKLTEDSMKDICKALKSAKPIEDNSEYHIPIYIYGLGASMHYTSSMTISYIQAIFNGLSYEFSIKEIEMDDGGGYQVLQLNKQAAEAISQICEHLYAQFKDKKDPISLKKIIESFPNSKNSLNLSPTV